MKLGFWSGIGKPLSVGLGGGVSDTTAPTCTITSTETSPTFAATIPLTITFSEAVTGFAVGDITVVGCTLGTLSTSDNITFSVTATPTANAITVDIAEGVCTDAAGNTNTAATQFAIMSLIANLKAWFDFSDITTLSQDSAGTTPVTADGQPIGKVADKSGNNNHALQAGVDTIKPTYKVNIQNSRSAALGDGGDSMATAAFTELAQPNTIFIVARNPALSGTEFFFDGVSAAAENVIYTNTKTNWSAGTNRAITESPPTDAILYSALFSGANSVLWRNGVQLDAGNVGTMGMTGVTLFALWNAGSKLAGYIMEFMIYHGELSTPVRQAIESILMTKWINP